MDITVEYISVTSSNSFQELRLAVRLNTCFAHALANLLSIQYYLLLEDCQCSGIAPKWGIEEIKESSETRQGRRHKVPRNKSTTKTKRN